MCRYFQFTINRALDDDRPLARRVQRHLTRCAVCRDYHESRRSLANELRARVPRPSVEASPYLRNRILNEIKAGSRRTAPAFSSRWVAAGCAVALFALTILFVRRPAEPAAPLIVAGEVSSKPAPPAATRLLETTTRHADGGQLLRAATQLDRPLQIEMGLVLNDARTALRSLQTEFVPAPLLARNE